jgi:hypothetical protein
MFEKFKAFRERPECMTWPRWRSRVGILIITAVCHDHSVSSGFAAADQL